MNIVKYLVMDVDGTLTDGKIYMGEHGEICKAFDVKDGCGIHELAIPNGIKPVIITGRISDIVSRRCQELEIELVYQGVKDKLKKLKSTISDLSQVAYIGDDINDLPCMMEVKKNGGVVGCPQDSVKEILNISDFVSSYKGGNGAVREFIEWILY
ncbi:3-deoxy-D-manno-octulosonate 8-phosphate phosphatase [Clostridium sp. OM02-18AC]|uniref:KdsC family phosphatase n=1 Tax=Clostridium sp. OM02-18AC TaxID=2292311 RepID=UPI0015F8EF68|nr:3-deoxy-D-manno-octulosonate 8-phosphate phosphatase [Clostridium sp. OM02-18AC]